MAKFYGAPSQHILTKHDLLGDLLQAPLFQNHYDHSPLLLLRSWKKRWEKRQRLIHLADYLIRDMGLTREQVMVEYRRPFWEKGIY